MPRINIADLDYLYPQEYKDVMDAVPFDRMVQRFRRRGIATQVNIASTILQLYGSVLTFTQSRFFCDFLFEHMDATAISVFLQQRTSVFYVLEKLSFMPVDELVHALAVTVFSPAYVVREEVFDCMLRIGKTRFPPAQLAADLCRTILGLCDRMPEDYTAGISLAPLLLDPVLGPACLQSDVAYALLAIPGDASFGFDAPAMLSALTSTPRRRVRGLALPALLYRSGRLDLLLAVLEHAPAFAALQNDDRSTLFAHVFELSPRLRALLLRHGRPTDVDLQRLPHFITIPDARALVHHVCLDALLPAVRDMRADNVDEFLKLADQLTSGDLESLFRSDFGTSFFFPLYRADRILAAADPQTLDALVVKVTKVLATCRPFYCCSKRASLPLFDAEPRLVDLVYSFLPCNQMAANADCFLAHARAHLARNLAPASRHKRPAASAPARSFKRRSG